VVGGRIGILFGVQIPTIQFLLYSEAAYTRQLFSGLSSREGVHLLRALSQTPRSDPWTSSFSSSHAEFRALYTRFRKRLREVPYRPPFDTRLPVPNLKSNLKGLKGDCGSGREARPNGPKWGRGSDEESSSA